MKSQPTTETTARRLAMYAAGMSTFMLVLVIGFGLRTGGQLFAAVALVIGLASAGMAWYSYRRYMKLRDARWQQELAHSESEMLEAFGPERSDGSVSTAQKPEEQPLAGP